MTTLMTVNGLSAEINTPVAPEGSGTHGLPPYDRQEVYVVDEYPGCPTDWMHGSDKASSYFLKLTPGKHLWLDLNHVWKHTNHVAAVISIQGINPITGQQTKELRLEQYHEKCPVHDISFKQDRFCEKCDYMWPGQNYMTTVSTPRGRMWIDGFRAEKGEVRGFLITADTLRGVATQLIDSDRVFAIGIAFYLSKEPKPPVQLPQLRMPESVQPIYKKYLMAPPTMNDYSVWTNTAEPTKVYSMSASVKRERSVALNSVVRGMVPSEELTSGFLRTLDDATNSPEMAVDTKLEIAAGAKIDQELAYFDPSDLSFYQDEPVGMLYINYATAKQFDTIIKQGKKDFTKGGEGFLAGLRTGNG